MKAFYFVVKSGNCSRLVKSFRIWIAVGPGLGWISMLLAMISNDKTCRCLYIVRRQKGAQGNVLIYQVFQVDQTTVDYTL